MTSKKTEPWLTDSDSMFTGDSRQKNMYWGWTKVFLWILQIFSPLYGNVTLSVQNIYLQNEYKYTLSQGKGFQLFTLHFRSQHYCSFSTQKYRGLWPNPICTLRCWNLCSGSARPLVAMWMLGCSCTLLGHCCKWTEMWQVHQWLSKDLLASVSQQWGGGSGAFWDEEGEG